MNKNYEKSESKIGAIVTIAGSVCMLSGAALLGASGADLDVALENNDIIGYIVKAKTVKTLLITNLSIWILGECCLV